MLAKRMEKLGTETAFEVLARAKALEADGRDIVHLEIGEPDFDTPRNIIDAGIEALNSGYTHYGPSAGLPQVRDIFAAHIANDRGIDVAGENVVIVPDWEWYPVSVYSPGFEVVDWEHVARQRLQGDTVSLWVCSVDIQVSFSPAQAARLEQLRGLGQVRESRRLAEGITLDRIDLPARARAPGGER